MHQQESYPLGSDSGSSAPEKTRSKARSWIPAFAGMTVIRNARRPENRQRSKWFPAFAGMTAGDFPCTGKESYPLARRDSGSSAPEKTRSKARSWIPAFAGMTGLQKSAAHREPKKIKMDSCAGMTSKRGTPCCDKPKRAKAQRRQGAPLLHWRYDTRNMAPRAENPERAEKRKMPAQRPRQ